MIFTIKKLLAYGLSLLMTLIVAWAVGFMLFLYGLYHQTPPSNDIHSDAIVVLTGGDERVKEGIRLLNQNVGNLLLISGVGQRVTTEDILRASGFGAQIGDTAFKSRITLGHVATNTMQNAEETRAWVEANHVQSIRLVTAYYHMPRSQLELHSLMPQITILEHPVHPNGSQLWQKPDFNLAFIEYHKYIAVLLRQAGLWQAS